MRSQFQKSRVGSSKFRAILYFPIIRPILIVFPVFTVIFFSTYGISLIFLDNVLAFLISENLAALISLLIANLIEKKYAKINRY
ncbi:MAG: hypothetical protein ACTSO6_11385 [Promethearchaeota archaeon]